MFGESPPFQVHRKNSNENDELHLFMDIQQPSFQSDMFTNINGRSNHLGCNNNGGVSSLRTTLASMSGGILTCFSKTEYLAQGKGNICRVNISDVYPRMQSYRFSGNPSHGELNHGPFDPKLVVFITTQLIVQNDKQCRMLDEDN